MYIKSNVKIQHTKDDICKHSMESSMKELFSDLLNGLAQEKGEREDENKDGRRTEKMKDRRKAGERDDYTLNFYVHLYSCPV